MGLNEHSPLPPASTGIAMMCEFLDIVDKAVELPLRIDFGSAAQGKAIEPLVVSKIAEHRLHRREAPAVEQPSLWRIDAFLHPVGM